MSSTPPPSTAGRDLALKVLDSALVIATALAALYFAGWTYRQAYYGRFAIDPTNLGSSNIAVAVEGIGAILTTTGAWLMAILPLLIGAALILLAGRAIDRARGTRPPFFDPLAVFMARIGISTIGVLLIMAAGQVAGTSRAKDRLANVKNDQVWTYHVGTQTIAGVTLAQGGDTTWLLTKAGVRPVKTADIRLIDGPLFTRVAHGG
ncbi:hypothetical protein FHT00_003370 [Sphingomonas insulae]|uniref:Uncharacterized protein n=1 Tax=Sphingomonas insulae TaxID=424800 RepID=A0ABP3T5U0_9SPHN|nr:hypothetical protein [Sphingomonas insulae]NIJ31390.1 hypothetical protein [Sphingomonas insulae]